LQLPAGQACQLLEEEVRRLKASARLDAGGNRRLPCFSRSGRSSSGCSYSIDGQPYATATYEPGTVPATGYFGFAVYQPQDILVEDIRITPPE
jgi:hypothetical protein